MNDSMVAIIFVMAIATFLTRRLMLTVPEKYLTTKIKRGLRYMPIGVFVALIVPVLMMENGELTFKPAYVLASTVCILLYVWQKNFLQSFLGGLMVAVVGMYFL